jgi:CheY-like chemotaxis protein
MAAANNFKKGCEVMSDEPTVVLYVDDNPRSRRLLTSVLANCGFKVVAAADPDEALQHCKKCSFDLALFDYQMPAMTGSDLAREIKRFAPDLPVVLISGCSALPASELLNVNAHFGRGSALDDLVDTMWKLARPKSVRAISPRSTTAWADST